MTGKVGIFLEKISGNLPCRGTSWEPAFESTTSSTTAAMHLSTCVHLGFLCVRPKQFPPLHCVKNVGKCCPFEKQLLQPVHVVTCGYMWLHVVTCGYMWLHVHDVIPEKVGFSVGVTVLEVCSVKKIAYTTQLFPAPGTLVYSIS